MVVKIKTISQERYIICQKHKEKYTEVLTGTKYLASDVRDKDVSQLFVYSEILIPYGFKQGYDLIVTASELLEICIALNVELKLQSQDVEDNRLLNILDKATEAFFPKEGVWKSSCFRRSNELAKGNLPCHLRDDEWLAQMLYINQDLHNISKRRVFQYVKESDFFAQKRHEYELEIVKWQIGWIMGHGEGWVCDEEYGGDIVYLTPVVDLGIRKGIVDTLIKIGMDREVIEEGIEKYADLWRESCMNSAFRNAFEPVYYLSKKQPEPISEEHKEKWLQMRRYEYYQRHKNSVDKYGNVSKDMLLCGRELKELQMYLESANTKRLKYLEKFKQKQ